MQLFCWFFLHERMFYGGHDGLHLIKYSATHSAKHDLVIELISPFFHCVILFPHHSHTHARGRQFSHSFCVMNPFCESSSLTENYLAAGARDKIRQQQ